jgi:hypothetical protein
MDKSPRPKKNPFTKSMAPKKSMRPRTRSDKEFETEMTETVKRAGRTSQPDKMAMGGKPKKMAMGGKCRGMGAAKKGGSYSKNG